ncbi:MAG TPA: hypothetical protein VI542_02100, partial [Candidatus Tectomicrobia bacterium]
ERGELAADDAATDDDHRRRQRLEPEGLVAGQIADVVQARQRRDQRTGAAGDDEPLRLVPLAGAVDGVRTEKPDRAFQQGDLLKDGATSRVKRRMEWRSRSYAGCVTRYSAR